MTTTQMLDRETIGRGAIAEYEAFAALLESLSFVEWRTPTRCEGFAVCDVAGHVVGLAEDVVIGAPGSRTAEEEAASVRDYGPDGAAVRLRVAIEALQGLLSVLDDEAWAGPSGLPDLTLGRGVLTLWYDTFVHADDIRVALGRESEGGPGLDASVAYLSEELERRGWGPAQLALDGVASHAIGTGGPTVTGDAMQFVLAATGRADPAPLGLDPRVNIYAA